MSARRRIRALADVEWMKQEVARQLKLEKEREQDNKRESKTANEKTKALPPDLEEYLKQKSKEQELLLTIPPALQPFYKDKTKEYFNKLGNP